MEKLDRCLHTLLENSSTITLVVKHSILRDAACGLVYLHSRVPSVVHRDLTARNSLLTTNMVAKIADLGVARIFDVKRGNMIKTMTNVPGNVVYMPPEAIEAGCKYNTSIDVFSFGNVALFTLTQSFPTILAATYPHPKKDKVIGRTEIERRGKYFEMLYEALGKNHSLVNLVTKCLQSKPNSRPSAHENRGRQSILEYVQGRADALRKHQRERDGEVGGAAWHAAEYDMLSSRADGIL